MEQRRLSRGGAGPLRRMPHAAKRGACAQQPPEICRHGDAGWRAFNISSDKTHRRRRLARRGSAFLSFDRSTLRVTAPPRARWARRSTTASASSRRKISAPWGLICVAVPAIASTDLPATLAPAAPASHKDGGGTPDPRGKMVFEGACASCHDWTGESPISPFATLTGRLGRHDPRRDQCRPDRDFRNQAGSAKGRTLHACVRQHPIPTPKSRPWPTTSPPASAARDRSSPRRTWADLRKQATQE